MHIDVRVWRVNWETHNLVGSLCCVLGQNTSSLHQGILMSINILSRKPDEMLGGTLWWTSIPSRRGEYYYWYSYLIGTKFRVFRDGKKIVKLMTWNKTPQGIWACKNLIPCRKYEKKKKRKKDQHVIATKYNNNNKWQINSLLQYSKIQISFAIYKEKGVFHYQINKFTILVTNNILIDGKGASGSTGLNIVWVRFLLPNH